MEKNCLVTSLQGSEQNENLPFFDVLEIKIDSQSINGEAVHYNSPVIAKATGTIQFVDAQGAPLNPSQEVELYDDNVRISAGKGSLLLPLFTMNTFNLSWNGAPVDMAFNIDDVIEWNENDLAAINLDMGSSDLNPNIVGDLSRAKIKAGEIRLRGCTGLSGNVLKLVGASTTRLDTVRTNLAFNVSDLDGSVALSYLGINEKVIGNIANLGKLPALATLSYQSANGVKSSLTGNFSDFVTNAIAARQAAGGTGAGSLTVYAVKTNFPLVTWPSPITNSTTTISWDASGNITVNA